MLDLWQCSNLKNSQQIQGYDPRKQNLLVDRVRATSKGLQVTSVPTAATFVIMWYLEPRITSDKIWFTWTFIVNTSYTLKKPRRQRYESWITVKLYSTDSQDTYCRGNGFGRSSYAPPGLGRRPRAPPPIAGFNLPCHVCVVCQFFLQTSRFQGLSFAFYALYISEDHIYLMEIRSAFRTNFNPL